MSDSEPIALVTGFMPFGGENINPSQQIAQALDGELVAGRRVVGATLPTEFSFVMQRLESLIDEHEPELVLAVGQAGGRGGLSLERVAINLIDARIADNAGLAPIDIPAVEGGPNAYFTSLPVKAMLSRLEAAGIPAAISHSAGTFVCNQVFFGLAHLQATRFAHLRGGFVHVPYLPEQAEHRVDVPSMPLDTMIAGVRLCLEVALTTDEDLHFPAGATH